MLQVNEDCISLIISSISDITYYDIKHFFLTCSTIQNMKTHSQIQQKINLKKERLSSSLEILNNSSDFLVISHAIYSNTLYSSQSLLDHNLYSDICRCSQNEQNGSHYSKQDPLQYLITCSDNRFSQLTSAQSIINTKYNDYENMIMHNPLNCLLLKSPDPTEKIDGVTFLGTTKNFYIVNGKGDQINFSINLNVGDTIKYLYLTINGRDIIVLSYPYLYSVKDTINLINAEPIEEEKCLFRENSVAGCIENSLREILMSEKICFKTEEITIK